MSIYQYLHENPIIAYIMAVLVASIVVFVCNLVKDAYIGTLKFFVLWKHGYPPAHCDAEGDAVELE